MPIRISYARVSQESSSSSCVSHSTQLITRDHYQNSKPTHAARTATSSLHTLGPNNITNKFFHTEEKFVFLVKKYDHIKLNIKRLVLMDRIKVIQLLAKLVSVQLQIDNSDSLKKYESWNKQRNFAAAA